MGEASLKSAGILAANMAQAPYGFKRQMQTRRQP